MIFFSTNAMPFKTDTVGFIDISSNVCVAFSSSSFGYLMLSSPHSFSRYEKQIFPQMAQSFLPTSDYFRDDVQNRIDDYQAYDPCS